MRPFCDLRAQVLANRELLSAAVDRVLESGEYILGGEGRRFELEFARYLGAGSAVGVASGTAAIALALRALGVGRGDEVAVPAMTAPPTALAVWAAGATPVAVDVDAETLTLDPEALARALSPATRAVVPVHLYGQCADMQPILSLAEERGLGVVEDAAQAHGAEDRGRRAGTIAPLAAFSFYPTKNLGAYGDAGAVVARDPALAARVRALRDYGRREGGFEEPGWNERLDELQAAILGAKLPLLDAWNERRRRHAARYREALRGGPVRLLRERAEGRHVYHQFVVLAPRREELRAHLAREGVGTGIHYPQALHQLPGLRGVLRVPEPPRRAEEAAAQVLSLPVYPELPAADLERAIDAVLRFA